MDTFSFIGVLILLIVFIGVFVVATPYEFEDDEQNKLYNRSLPKTDPVITSKTGTPG